MVERSHTAGWWPQMSEPLRRFGEKLSDWFAPRSDAAVTSDHYEINLELPGVAADDIEVSVDDGVLSVKGEKHFAHEQSGRRYFFSEREYGAFQRSFRLPEDAVTSDIGATFKDGVLKLLVPKATKRPAAARKVSVRSG